VRTPASSLISIGVAMSFGSHSGASGNSGLNESVGWIIADNFDNAELQ